MHGIGDSLRHEVGTRTPEHHEDDVVEPIPDDPDGDTEHIVTSNYIYYTNISGNAYEQIHEEEGRVVAYNDNPRIANIKVEAIHRDSTTYKVYTDVNGNYSFESKNLKPGEYTLKFTYGYYDESKSDEIDDMKNILKYNGLDYTAMAAGETIDTTTTMEKIIKHSGAGATEIILAIDCSASACNTRISNGQTRLELQKEAAKKLIESLIDQKNVYIGIVCFAGGDSAYLALDTTNKLDLLTETLDEIKPGGKCDYTTLEGGTNLIFALNKSKGSYASDKSNKWIVLLSDGAPTTDGIKQIYRDDSDEDLLDKLRSITNNTKKTVKEILKEDIKICSFIVDSNDSLEQEIVEEIFNVDGNKYFHSSDEEATKYIKDEILKHIIDTTTVEENVTETVDIREFDGLEDESRRKDVNNLNNTYDYAKSQIIDNLIKNYTYDANSKQQAKKILDDSFMTVTVTRKYEIDKLIDQDDEYWYFNGKDGDYTKSKHQFTTIEEKTYTNHNLELRKRSLLDMEVYIKVTGYRLTLANGQIYNQKTTNGVVDKDLDKKTVLKDIKEIGDAIFLQSIDAKLMYGARVDIEYTIILKNISSVPVSNVTLINYLTDFSSGNELPILEFDKNRKMITNQYTNEEYGWGEVDNNADLSNKVSEKTYANMKNAKYITLKTSESSLLRNEQQLGSNGERYIKLVLSKHLSTDTKNDNTDFSTTTEILDYSNDLGIRMRKHYTNPSGVHERLSVIPGNTVDGINKVVDINSNYISETDYAKSMRVVIIPPTGGKTDIALSLIIFVEVLLIVLLRELRKSSRG